MLPGRSMPLVVAVQLVGEVRHPVAVLAPRGGLAHDAHDGDMGEADLGGDLTVGGAEVMRPADGLVAALAPVVSLLAAETQLARTLVVEGHGRESTGHRRHEARSRSSN